MDPLFRQVCVPGYAHTRCPYARSSVTQLRCACSYMVHAYSGQCTQETFAPVHRVTIGAAREISSGRCVCVRIIRIKRTCKFVRCHQRKANNTSVGTPSSLRGLGCLWPLRGAPSEQSSLFSVMPVCEFSAGRTIVEYPLPVMLNVFGSTPVMLHPTAAIRRGGGVNYFVDPVGRTETIVAPIGNVFLMLRMLILCMTTLFRSPCCRRRIVFKHRPQRLQSPTLRGTTTTTHRHLLRVALQIGEAILF